MSKAEDAKVRQIERYLSCLINRRNRALAECNSVVLKKISIEMYGILNTLDILGYKYRYDCDNCSFHVKEIKE